MSYFIYRDVRIIVSGKEKYRRDEEQAETRHKVTVPVTDTQTKKRFNKGTALERSSKPITVGFKLVIPQKKNKKKNKKHVFCVHIRSASQRRF